MELVTYCKLS